jgi:hypothetical protein
VLRRGGSKAFSMEQKRHPAVASGTFVSRTVFHLFGLSE